jgi:hypothetical protein
VFHFEITREQFIFAPNIAAQYYIKHRRVYDFLQLLSALGICGKIDGDGFRWIGQNAAPETIGIVYTQVELDSLRRGMEAVCNLGNQPRLALIALRFLCLYLYLGVESLSLHRIGSLFHDESGHTRYIWGKLYVVLPFLEDLGIVAQTDTDHEYRLILERTMIVENAMKKKLEACRELGTRVVEPLLNWDDPDFVHRLQADRVEIFKRLTKSSD